MWNGTEIEITLIRHGATKSNLEHRYLGRTDEPLCPEGIQSLKNKSYPTPKRLFVSPMLRCRQTAEILFPHTPFQCISEWTEMDFGAFEGKNYQELKGNAAYQAWIDSNAALPFPEGEGQETFQERVMQGFFHMLTQTENPTALTAVVHGGTIMTICSRLFGGAYFDYQLGCAEGYVCHFLYKEERIKGMEFKRLC